MARALTTTAFVLASFVASPSRADTVDLAVAPVCSDAAGHFSLRAVHVYNNRIRSDGNYDDLLFMTSEPTLVHTCQVAAHKVEVWTHRNDSLFDQRICGALKGFLFQVKVDGKAVEFPNTP